MQYLVLFVTLMLTLPVFATEMEMVEVAEHSNRWSAGAGMEGRVAQDTNPEILQSKMLPQFFAQYRFLGAWAATVEGGFEQQDTSSGGLSVSTETYQLGLWGRYEFGEQLHWSPFATAGAGYFFDQVTSKFASESVTYEGNRRFWGFGGGISTAVWKHMLLEGEIRAALIQDRKDLAYSAILRVGFVL